MFWVVGVVGVVLLVTSLVFDDVVDGLLPDVGWFSGAVLGAFLAAFGVVGWAADASLDGGAVIPLLAGVLGGVAIGAVTARVTVALLRNPTDATPTTDALVGHDGRIVTPVRAGGFGEVVVTLGGQPVKLAATAADDIPTGERVTVVAVESSTKVVVERTSTFWS